MNEAVRIQNPNALHIPAIRDMLYTGFQKSPWAHLGTEVLGLLENLVRSPSYSLLLMREGIKWVGFSLVSLPESPLDTTPQVVYFYNSGTAEARKTLVKATVDFIHTSGYTRFWAINYSGLPDDKWKAKMKADGWDIKPIATVMEFTRG